MPQKMSSSDPNAPTDSTPMCRMPFISFPEPEMTLFNPQDPNLKKPTNFDGELDFSRAVKFNPHKVLIPRPEDCRMLWDKYEMMSHIRDHSSKVAVFMLALAKLANKAGLKINEDAAYAVGMLHDLGKTYCIQYKGSHAQVGATWVMRETRNAPISRAVLLHVHFPWEDLLEETIRDTNFFLPIAVIYADKRVRHDEYVSIDERFVDLRARYGVSDYVLGRIEVSRQQGVTIEKALSKILGIDLNAYTPDYGRLVR